MKQNRQTLFLLLAGSSLIFLALFPALSFDAVLMLIERAPLLERGNFALLLYLEISRGVTTTIALITAAWLLLRAAHTPDGRSLALLVIFGAITFEKLFGTAPYAGPLQQMLVLKLQSAGVSRATLAWIFGPLPWSWWPALVAALRLSVVFTRPPLSAELIDDSGRRDRRGWLRDSGVAGIDVGAAFRRWSKLALARGWFQPLPLAGLAVLLIVFTTMLPQPGRGVLVAIGSVVLVALAITNLRASYLAAPVHEQRRMHWLVLGVYLAVAFALVAAAPLLLFEHSAVQIPALVLLMLAPAAVTICLAIGVMYRGGRDPRHLLRSLYLLR